MINNEKGKKKHRYGNFFYYLLMYQGAPKETIENDEENRIYFTYFTLPFAHTSKREEEKKL